MRKPREWTVTARRSAFEHPLLAVELRQIEAHGDVREVLALRTADWVNVIPIMKNRDGENEIVLVRQWRYAIEQTTLEIPGGIVDPGEISEQAGRRELLEETGFRAATWQSLGVIHPNPAILNNRCHTVLVEDATERGPCALETHEEISVRLVPIDDIARLISGGHIHHALVVAAFHHLALRERLG